MRVLIKKQIKKLYTICQNNKNLYNLFKIIKNWYATMFLNIGLSFLDERKLKKLNTILVNLEGWVLLVPVYLYKRAKACGHSLAYFITWMIFVMLLG